MAVLSDMSIDRNNVPDGLRLDLLGPIGVLEGVVRLVVVSTRRRDANDHDGLAVSTERLLEESSKFRISIGDMPTLPRIAEGVDAVSEGEQGPVDVGSFDKPISFVLRDASPLRTS